MNKRPTNGEVCIVDYEPKYKDAWHDLNAQWITQYWQLEPHDLEVLGNPQETIIDKGGYIFVALYEGKPVGVCALCTIDNPKDRKSVV